MQDRFTTSNHMLSLAALFAITGHTATGKIYLVLSLPGGQGYLAKLEASHQVLLK